MRGLTRSSVKHVCSSCFLQVRRQNVLQLSNTSSLNSSLRSIAIPLSLRERPRHVSSISKHRRSRNGRSPRIPPVSEYATEAKTAIELNDAHRQKIDAVYRVKQRLTAAAHAAHNAMGPDGKRAIKTELSLYALIDPMPPSSEEDEEQLLSLLKEKFGEKSVATTEVLLHKVAQHRKVPQRKVTDTETVGLMVALGIVDGSAGIADFPMSQSIDKNATPNAEDGSGGKVSPRRGVLMNALTATQESRKANIAAKSSNKLSNKQSPTQEATAGRAATRQSLNPQDLILEPLEIDGHSPRIPKLSYDLSRVLFNPGIYHLQDPRSRVFNFDPYLAEPMPVSEFNFRALNAYITSSKDKTLIGHALAHGKRYIGSSSSMSGAMCQFHFLLSQFRPINTANLSKGFGEERTDFTQISKAPAAIFLRWRDGVYAVDADKEYDEPNVLLSLGKAMEKLLTLEKDEMEKWRRTGRVDDDTFSDPEEEAYHYSTQGDFLLRSQLDAQDSRLPGTGVFDLKTRAVAGIRMNIQDHEVGTGYQIKNRFGTWESFEREYYDMIRSAFLKYSIQVRMGNMDGIFVAYHNIRRLFGFQYIPITELDLALHGQSDPSIGDKEFRMSISLLDEIFDKVTSKFPKESIRFFLETRDASAREQKPYMYIFAEPMSNEEIDLIQTEQDSDFEAYERKITEEEGSDNEAVTDDEQASSAVSEQDGTALSSNPSSDTDFSTVPRSSDSSDADQQALDRIIQQVPADTKAPEPRSLLGFKLVISNKVNGVTTLRPEQITDKANWTVDYWIDELADNEARKAYIACKNRRKSALKTSLKQNHSFVSGLNEMSRSGAKWRQEQDEIDAQRERVVLYPVK